MERQVPRGDLSRPDPDGPGLLEHRHYDLVVELVRDYRLEMLTNAGWSEAVTVSGNRHRHRVHSFTPRSATALRLVVEDAACGEARSYEMRVYGPGGLDHQSEPASGKGRQ